MAIKSEEYNGYIEKTIEYRKTKLDYWKLSERSEEDYKLLSILTPYTLEEYEGKFPNLNLRKEQAFYFSTRYDFQLLAEYLETIENSDSKLLFLIEIKADFEHDSKRMYVMRVTSGNYEVNFYLNFGELCQVEIDRIEKLQEFDRRQAEKHILQRKQFNAIIERGAKRNPTTTRDLQSGEKDSSGKSELTTTQQVLAAHYFLKFIGAKDVNSSVIARLIAVFRGGKNYKEIYDKVRESSDLIFLNKGDDARLIADLYKKLGQPEIARMIENDLDEINPRRNKL